jgi:hypothetical protein
MYKQILFFIIWNKDYSIFVPTLHEGQLFIQFNKAI